MLTRRRSRVPVGRFAIVLSLFGYCILGIGTLVPPQSARAQQLTSTPAQRCAALLRLDLEGLPDAPTRITVARIVDDSAVLATLTTPHATSDGSRVRSYCQVTGYVAPQDKFELRLPAPTEWNQKFFFAACKGFCGAVVGSACNPSLARGYASATTNGGHEGLGPPIFDGYWARNAPSLQEDFAWRGTHVVTLAAKEITTRYYGAPIVHSYISGCSKGGQAVMMETQRFPQDYDGAIPIAPVYDFGTGAVRALWIAQAVSDGSGRSVLNPAVAAAVHRSVLSACGAQSGVDDGMVTDPTSCGWRPESIACRPNESSADCLSPVQVAAIAKVMRLPENSNGMVAYFAALLPGAETNWAGWLFPNAPDGTIREMGMYAYPEQFMRYMAHPTAMPAVNPLRFALDSAPRFLERAHRVYDATSTDLRAFRNRGGKMVMWHGLADASISATGTIQYYQALDRAEGGRASDFVRLFLVPGVHHCTGGPGPDDVDALSALENWVERGVAPEVIVARHLTNGLTDRTWPVYPYPTLTRYSGTGDPQRASSYRPFRRDRR